MNDTKKYIAYLVAWITSHCDIELDATTEFEVIRVIFDAYEQWIKEQTVKGADE